MVFNIEVIDSGTVRRISHWPGSNLLETLRGAGIAIRTGCQEIGACALCKVIVKEGKAGPVTSSEELQLSHWLSQGMRLACQVIPEGNLVVELIPEASPVVANSEFIGRQSAYLPDARSGNISKNGYGIAIDIGTTNISMSIFQRENGEQLARRTFSNPQCEYGTDVIARLVKASEDLNTARDLQNKLFNKVKEGLQELASTVHIELEDIVRIGVVGNTTMLALFHHCSYQQLLDPQYWGKTLVFPDADEKSIVEFFRINRQASFKIIDPLAGFVGSDLLAGATAVRLLDKEPGTLFLDFGTNTEIALWDGRTVWVTAAAGGPAFEGCGMSYGSAAVPGAIFQVCSSDEPGSPFKVQTIQNHEAIGICGSGYIGVISTLLDRNILDRVGRLSSKVTSNQEITVIEKPLIKVTKKDIDMFQRAKGAVAAGIRVLLHRAGMYSTDLRQIYVAGNFGQFLDIPNSQSIGLLPSIQPDYVYLCGNAALRGCQDVLLYKTAEEMLAIIRTKANYINLAFDSEFESIFIDSLYLRPF